MTSVRRVVVTGANRGIGKAICLKLLQDQKDIHVILGSRDQMKGEEAVTSIINEVGAEHNSRIESVVIDVSNPSSIADAATELKNKYTEATPIYGLINNAGVGFGPSFAEIMQTNLRGLVNVTNAFLPLLNKKGRIVNISSASGPNFVSKLDQQTQLLFTDPSTDWNQIEAIISEYTEQVEKDPETENVAYGLSKACVNLYTAQLAQLHPDMCINSCTPGFIASDMGLRIGAKNPTVMGTVAPLYCLLSDPNEVKTGRYYGSDAVRSPLDRYRGPGEPPYVP